MKLNLNFVILLTILLFTKTAIAMENKTVNKTTVLGYTFTTTLKKLTVDMGNIPNEMVAKTTELGIEITGSQIWVYEGADGYPDTKIKVTIAIPIKESKGNPGKFAFLELPEFKCATEIHKGAYSKLGETYHKVFPEIMSKGLTYTGITREVYHVCDFVNQENCVTEIQIEVK